MRVEHAFGYAPMYANGHFDLSVSQAAAGPTTPVPGHVEQAPRDPEPHEPAEHDAGDVEADVSGDEGLIHSDEDEAASESSQVDAAVAAAAAAAAAKGRGRDRGKGGRKGGRAGAKGRGRGRGGGDGKQPKYVWVDAADHEFTPREEYGGAKQPQLSSKFDGLSLDSPIAEWFVQFDGPDTEYTERAVNSNDYRALHVCYSYMSVTVNVDI